MEPGTQTVAAVGDNFGIVGGFLGGLAKAAGLKAQARAVEQQGVQASAQSNERVEQLRREGRQQLGEQVADISQSGIGFTATTRDTMNQSAANLELDSMNVGYEGLVQRIGFDNQATALRHEASAAPFTGALTGGLKALTKIYGYGMGG